MSADLTKAEKARHKLLVEELNSQRARGETDIIIRGDSIVTRAIIIIIIIITSSGDLQPSTAIANQLPGHLVSTQI